MADYTSVLNDDLEAKDSIPADMRRLDINDVLAMIPPSALNYSQLWVVKQVLAEYITVICLKWRWSGESECK